MEYTFNNVRDILDSGKLNGFSCVIEEKPLPILQDVFDEMKKEYIRARNITTEIFIEDYGEEEGVIIMNERYPKPVNIDELANQAKIIANKYEICGTTLMHKRPGFIVKMPNIRVRVRTYCNLGDYYCWIQKFGIDKFTLKIYQAMPNEEGYLIFGGSSYPHPHIAGDNPCLGSYDGVIKNCAGHFNMVGVLSNIKTYLNSYYGRSVYLRVNEFRPVKISSLPIEILKDYPANYITFDNYWDNSFKDEPLLRPKYGSDDYNKIKDNYMDKYSEKIEKIEISPSHSNFYSALYGMHDVQAMYTPIVQQVRMMMHQFDCDDYYQMYALLITHGKSINGTPIVWGKKYHDYDSAWKFMHDTCLGGSNRTYRTGYGSGISIVPDIRMRDTTFMPKVVALERLIWPSENDGVYTVTNKTCKEFWEYISKFKTIEDFLVPQNNHDDRKDEVLRQIDKLYPEVTEWSDAYARKIILTIDKQKRRIQNGLKHTKPASESNQLSFDTVSQD